MLQSVGDFYFVFKNFVHPKVKISFALHYKPVYTRFLFNYPEFGVIEIRILIFSQTPKNTKLTSGLVTLHILKAVQKNICYKKREQIACGNDKRGLFSNPYRALFTTHIHSHSHATFLSPFCIPKGIQFVQPIPSRLVYSCSTLPGF